MRRFDPLALETSILGPHLLEASAGTGKTFSIEHIFIRLLLESKDPYLELEEILVVTFTRASTRELKERIRANLEKAIRFLESTEVSPWPYLNKWKGSKQALLRLKNAKVSFYQAQIFTIHGFCYRMLNEFAFEGGVRFSLPDPDKGRYNGKKQKKAVRAFLKDGIDEKELSLEQISLIMDLFSSMEELVEAILKTKGEKKVFFEEIEHKYERALQTHLFPVEIEKLLEDFFKTEQNYKALKGNFLDQVKALATSFQGEKKRESLGVLLREKGSLFRYLAENNKKVKTTSLQLHYPDFFSKAKLYLESIIEEGSNKKRLFKTLCSLWNEKKELYLDGETVFDPDEILAQMKEALKREPFSKKIKKAFRAVMIDEFQDTDEEQWEIFEGLFLKRELPLEALYLVGDPKQSIYRFRKADIYTYMKALDLIGKEALYFLDTNYRSSKKMIGTLNAFFSKNGFSLPKLSKTLSYKPVFAGKKEESSIEDGKGSVHAVYSFKADSFFEEGLLPYAVFEIEKLLEKGFSPSSFALLVKDRYQASRCLTLLKERGIPSFCKNSTPIGKTEAYKAIHELFNFVVSPEDLNALRIFEEGPFQNYVVPDLDLLKEGLVPFFKKLKIDEIDFLNPFDLRQIVEELFAWEAAEGFTIEGLIRFLDELAVLDIEHGGRRRIETKENAVQILTLHISKGLEFDIVFAFSLASSQPDPDEEKEEFDAEKQRQLYVAMTRAKKRLYLPLVLEKKEKNRSPMEIFWEKLEPSEILLEFEKLKKEQSFSFEEVQSPFLLPEKKIDVPLKKEKKDLLKVPFFQPKYLLSFSTLAKKKSSETLPPLNEKEGYSLHTIPRGAETGIVIHEIFEKIFSQDGPVWKEEKATLQIVSEVLKKGPLEPWKLCIEEGVKRALQQPLFEGLKLQDLEKKEVLSEMEFLFQEERHLVKGFIDLVFCWKGKYYFLDWKTNWLGENDAFYTTHYLEASMNFSDYWLQASLYKKALKDYLALFFKDQKDIELGDAIYYFFRGGKALCFQPEKQIKI